MLVELEQACPRPIPERLKQGHYNRRFKKWALGFAGAALALVILRVSPLFEAAAWYFPILGLANWIIVVFLILTVFFAWRSRRVGDPHKYYVWGKAHQATVENVSLVSTAESGGQVTHVAYLVRARLTDHRYLDFQSDSFELGKFTVTLTPKDRVVVLETTEDCCLYGFLRIDPRLDYLQQSELLLRNEKQGAIAAAVLITGVLGMIVAVNRFQLLDIWSNLTIGSTLLSLVPAIPIGRHLAKHCSDCSNQEKLTRLEIANTDTAQKQNVELSSFEKFGQEVYLPIVMFLGAWSLCWVSVFAVLVFVNGSWDRGGREKEIVTFERIQWESSDLITGFHVVYFYHDGKRQSYNLRHYDRFEDEIQSMSIFVRQGSLGARWIDGCSFNYSEKEESSS